MKYLQDGDLEHIRISPAAGASKAKIIVYSSDTGLIDRLMDEFGHFPSSIQVTTSTKIDDGLDTEGRYAAFQRIATTYQKKSPGEILKQ